LTTDDPTTQAAAAVWIKWLSDNSAEWAAAGQVPARESVRSDPNLASVAAPISQVVESANMVVFPAQAAGLESALWDQFGPVVDGYLAGDVTDLQAALDEAAARSQQVIEENKSLFGE
jgi:multiple sugar transport system substrate-binding protein